MMTRLKIIVLIMVAFISIVGCNSRNALKTPAETLVSNQPLGNPYPSVGTSTPQSSGNTTQTSGNPSYPDPIVNSGNVAQNTNPENFVDELIVPTTSSGKSIITGKLTTGDNNQPFITILYLAAVKPSDNPNQPPEINFSAKSDPMAIQEIGTGRFMFTEIIPGQYAVVVKTPGISYFIKDNQGNNLIIELKAGEVKDLGTIVIK